MRTESLQDQTIAALSICPLLFPVTSVATGIAMGVIFVSTLLLTAIIVYLLRGMIPAVLRVYMIALLAATVVALIQMSTRVFWYEFSLIFGIFLPLIAVNCVLLINNEEVVLRRSFNRVLADTARTAAIVLLLLAVIGLIRETFGAGTLFQHAGLLFGLPLDAWTIRLFDERYTWAILGTTPGAFIVAGLVFAFIRPGESHSSVHLPT